MLLPNDQELLNAILFDNRVSIQAAAYAVYVQLNPKRPISPREFHKEFLDNWQIFNSLEWEEMNRPNR